MLNTSYFNLNFNSKHTYFKCNLLLQGRNKSKQLYFEFKTNGEKNKKARKENSGLKFCYLFLVKFT